MVEIKIGGFYKNCEDSIIRIDHVSEASSDGHYVVTYTLIKHNMPYDKLRDYDNTFSSNTLYHHNLTPINNETLKVLYGTNENI